MTDAPDILRRPENDLGRVIRNEPKLGAPVERKPVPGRSCGTCTMCCKLYPVPPMDKPSNVWCKACSPGKGCGIWETRPQFCRDFHCHYILDADVGDDWRPDICKFIMNFQTSNMLYVKVDPANRLAWKEEPYYSVLKRLSEKFIAAGGHILVGDGRDAICITPSEDVVVARYGEPTKFHVHTKKVGMTTVHKVIVEQPEVA
jgi:hypothetical protein